MKPLVLSCPECHKQVFWDSGSAYGYCMHCLAKFGYDCTARASTKMTVSDLADNRRRTANTAFSNQQYRAAYEGFSKALEYDNFHPLLVLYQGISASYAFNAYDRLISNYRKAAAILEEYRCPTTLMDITDIFLDLFIDYLSGVKDSDGLILGLQAEMSIGEDFENHKHDLLLSILNRCQYIYDSSNGKLNKDQFIRLMSIVKRSSRLLKEMDEAPKKRGPLKLL